MRGGVGVVVGGWAVEADEGVEGDDAAGVGPGPLGGGGGGGGVVGGWAVEADEGVEVDDAAALELGHLGELHPHPLTGRGLGDAKARRPAAAPGGGGAAAAAGGPP